MPVLFRHGIHDGVVYCRFVQAIEFLATEVDSPSFISGSLRDSDVAGALEVVPERFCKVGGNNIGLCPFIQGRSEVVILMAFNPFPVNPNGESPNFCLDIGDEVKIRPCWTERPVTDGCLVGLVAVKAKHDRSFLDIM